MLSKPIQRQAQSGFTLMELSIVLLVIGLIAGGIILGADFIKYAGLRAVLTQHSQLDAAVNSFYTKYDCLAGDCPRATSYGFTDPYGSSAYNGNGDGMIGETNGWLFWPQNNNNGYERLLFMAQLQQASLISGWTYPNNVTKTGDGLQSKLRNTAWWVGYGVQAPGWWAWAGIAAPMGNILALVGPHDVCGYYTCGGSVFGEALLPAEAIWIDTKIDDGFPITGMVQAGSGNNYIDSGPVVAAAPDSCVVGYATNQYSNPNTNNLPRCNLLFKLKY